MGATNCLGRQRTRAWLSALPLLWALAACSAPPTAQASARAEAAVWAAVEARNDTWLADDLAGHMALYHPDFRRWSLHDRRLMTRSEFAGLWAAIKADEEARSLSVEREQVVFYAGGAVAIAHYTIRETWEWVGEDQTAEQGREAHRGEIMSGALRFSDVWVDVDGRWLYAGGHRDGMSLED